MSRVDKERRKSRQEDFQDSIATRVDLRGNGSMLQMTSELISSYSGQDSTYTAARWVQEVEDNAEIFGWTPLQQLLVARRALTGTAALWLRAERPFKTWEDLKAAIMKEFPDSVDMKTIHETMSTRKKHANENCLDYMLTMKELGKRGKMPDYVAIKYIIDGICDFESNKIMLYGVTTYSELKEKLRIYECVKNKMAQQQVRHPTRSKDVRNRCFSCGEIDHTSAYCPHKEKGTKCFKCNEFGHIATSCTNSYQRRNGTTTAPEHSRSRDRLHSTRFGQTRNPAHENERRQQDLKLKRTMFGQLTETTHSLEANTHSSNEEYDDVHSFVPHLSKSNTSMSNNNEVMQIVNNSSEGSCKPVKSITVCGLSVKALIDSGSDVNIISSKFYEKLGQPKAENANIVLSGIGQSVVRSLGMCSLQFVVDKQHFDGVFHILSSDYVPYNVIIGQEFLKSVTMLMTDGAVRLLPKDDEWMQCMLVDKHDFDSVVGPMADSELKRQVHRLIHTYGKPVQEKEAPIQLRIVLKDDIPVTHRPRRLSLKEQEIVEKQVSEWLEKKIIRVSYSEYSSPVVLVQKKDGTTRVCVDYRALNRKIVKDEFPLPIIEDVIDKLKDAKVFSILDLKNGFFHLKVTDDSIPYTSFVTHHGQFEFLRAPFGLSICPKSFMRFVSIIFRDLINKGIVSIFIDYILVRAIDEEQAVKH